MSQPDLPKTAAMLGLKEHATILRAMQLLQLGNLKAIVDGERLQGSIVQGSGSRQVCKAFTCLLCYHACTVSRCSVFIMKGLVGCYLCVLQLGKLKAMLRHELLSRDLHIVALGCRAACGHGQPGVGGRAARTNACMDQSGTHARSSHRDVSAKLAGWAWFWEEASCCTS